VFHRVTVALLTILTLAVSSAADTLVVDVDGGPGSDFTAIKDAVDAAADGDTVLVRPGTYSGARNRGMDFFGRSLVVVSQEGHSETTIDCELEGRAFHLFSGEDTTSVIEGFTIQNGDADNGGAIYLSGFSSPVIVDCVLTSSAADQGGALYCRSGSAPIVRGCLFTANEATEGGAVAADHAAPRFRNCTFVDNHSSTDGGSAFLRESDCVFAVCAFEGSHANADGGAVANIDSRSSFTDCEFLTGHAAYGGALFVSYAAEVTMSGCSFSQNIAAQRGGAVSLYSCSPEILECRFVENSARYGGALWGHYASPALTGCSFSANKATRTDGATAVELVHADIPSPEMTACTVSGSWVWSAGQALLRFEDCWPSLDRCIIAFARNGAAMTCEGIVGSPTITRSVIYGNMGGDEACGESGNIHIDPFLCDISVHDMGLCQTSPCLPENNQWRVLIGAYGQACGDCYTAVEHTSWGAIKGMYR